MKLSTLRALAEGDIENAIISATPGGIEAQEAQGQQDFVSNATLPIDCNFCNREQFEAIGIVYGEPVDDLFTAVILPAGWQKVAENHSMWSKLVDDKGRKRASIFYKAAFYDRSAHISLTRRFSYQGDYQDDDDWQNSPRRCIVTDCDETIWASGYIEPTEEVPGYTLSDQLNSQGKAWLDEHYPNWQDPLAYWE